MNKRNLFNLGMIGLVFMVGFSVVGGAPLPDGGIRDETCREGLSEFVTEANDCSNQHSVPESANFTSDVIKGDWGKVDDHRYGIAFQVLKDCQIVITIDQPQPFVDPQAIIRRYTAWCSQGLLDLDIWQTMGMTMDEWMKWYEDTRQPLGTVASRITIGEIEAVRYEESTLWTTLWSGEKYIYRLWYTHRGDQSGEEFYKRVLNSVGFLNEEPIKGEDASQSFQGLSLEGFATVNPLVTTCCGYTSPGNPFECCNNKGNCVWWVYYKYGYVPFRGDAGKWYGQVPDYPDWRRGRYPNRGMNIAWWSGSPGHVAFIANYPGGGTVTITEMLICTSCGRTRNLSVTAPEGYMWTIYN